MVGEATLDGVPWPRPLVIAVDGPAASGKSTLARRLATALGLAFLDTGLLYRAVGKALLDAGESPEDQAAATARALALRPEHVEAGLLGGEAVGRAASKVAAWPAVRAALLPFQRRFARSGRGAVLAGRDIASVVCPDASVKLYVTASPQARAERRWEELRGRGLPAIYARVLDDMLERDRRDSSRAVAPLRFGEDAFLIDTTELDADAALEAALHHVRERLGVTPD